MTERPYSYDWDDPETARFYEAFCDRHRRYDEANGALIGNAAVAPGHRILDLAAGTGRTAAALLPVIGDGTIDCVEPARAMRTAGQARITDARVAWLDKIPDGTADYDRIVCGAAIWQMHPLPALFTRLHQLIGPHGLLVFNIPALYLGDPDPPGGGDDPHLLTLPAAIADLYPASAAAPDPAPDGDTPLLTPSGIDQWLEEAGFQPRRWSGKLKFTQEAYRDWLKIPVISNRLFPGMSASRRARCIDEAYGRVDGKSWRWEIWAGWTARAQR